MGVKQQNNNIAALDPASKSEIKPVLKLMDDHKDMIDAKAEKAEIDALKKIIARQQEKLDTLFPPQPVSWKEVKNKPDFGDIAAYSAKDFIQSDMKINKKPLVADFFLTAKDVGLGNVPDTDTTNPKNISTDADHRWFTDAEREKLKGLDKPKQLRYTDLADTPKLSKSALSGSYSDLHNTPELGTAALRNHDDFATAHQGAKAETALQPNGDGSKLTNISKAQVGLDKVSNTSDDDKPISRDVERVLGQFSQSLVTLNSDIGQLKESVNRLSETDSTNPANIKWNDDMKTVTQRERDFWNSSQGLKWGEPTQNQAAQMSSLKVRVLRINGESIKVLTLD